jgi:hypothetical protein
MNMAWDKTPSQKEAVKAFLVTVDGKGDLEASVEKYRQVCRGYLASQTAEQDLVAQCMSELFDFRKGATLNLDYIKSQTVQLMTKKHPELGEPTLFAMLSGRVEEYLHSHCNYPATEAKGKRAAKEAITGQVYSVKHGLGGGFYRESDASKG